MIIDEVTRTLHRPRIQRKYQIRTADADWVCELLERETFVCSISTQMQGVASHPEDGLLLATAVSAQTVGPLPGRDDCQPPPLSGAPGCADTMKYTTTMTSKGQIVVPATVRKRLRPVVLFPY